MRTSAPYVSALLSLAAAFSLNACGESAEEAEAAVPLAWVGKGKCNRFYDMPRAGVEAAAADLSATTNGRATVSVYQWDDCSAEGLPPTTSDCATDPQIAEFKRAVDAAPKGIAVGVNSSSCLAPLIDDAVARGIRVITFDTDASGSARSTFFAADSVAAGTRAAELVNELTGGTGEVAIQAELEDPADPENVTSPFKKRVEAFKTALKQYPGLKMVTVLPCQTPSAEHPSCAFEVEKHLKAHPNTRAVFLAKSTLITEKTVPADAPTFVAAREAGTLKVVAYNAPENAIPGLKAGYADVAIAPPLFAWGYDATLLLFDLVTQNRPLESFTPLVWATVCANNIKDLEDRYRARDFRTPLPDCVLEK